MADESSAEFIEVKKDVDRAEEIKALTRAWESVEAGRAGKAMAARMGFLKANEVRIDLLEDKEYVENSEGITGGDTERQQANEISNKTDVSI